MKYIKTITLLALVTLFAACTVLHEPATGGGIDGGIIANDLVPVTVTINGNDGRTLLPNIGEGFTKFDVDAAPANGNIKEAPVTVTVTMEDYFQNGAVIAVPSGDWTITVTAKVTISDADYAVVKGSAPLTVNEWGDNNVTIALYTPETTGTGTFTYAVNYPAGASATVTLQPFNNGALGAAVTGLNNAAAGATPASQSIAGGFYFLTVKATKDSKTVTRNEVVHIYPCLTTTAAYRFTKLDFGTEPLKLSGTIGAVTVNGTAPDNFQIWCLSENGYWLADTPISNGDTEWEINISNFYDATSLHFTVFISDMLREDVYSMDVPLSDVENIHLQGVALTFSVDAAPLAAETWEYDYTETFAWYSVAVTAGQTYYFWWNNLNWVTGYDTNGNLIFGDYAAWNVSYFADTTGTIYIKADAWGNDYAIAYSTDRFWGPVEYENISVYLTDNTANGHGHQGNIPGYILNHNGVFTGEEYEITITFTSSRTVDNISAALVELAPPDYDWNECSNWDGFGDVIADEEQTVTFTLTIENDGSANDTNLYFATGAETENDLSEFYLYIYRMVITRR